MQLSLRLRQNVSSFVIWGLFLALYLGGAVLLAIGLVFSSRAWWALMQQGAGMRPIAAKTAEVVALAIGLLLILIAPFAQSQSAARSEGWKAERRSEMKRQDSVAE